MKWAFFLLVSALWAADYDCIFVGTSPIPLFEALYQEAIGNKVLILESAEEFGGAWKSIAACGIPHADLGCHQIGKNRDLADFLEVYGGCSIVSLDEPEIPFRADSKNGFYFAKGCYELVHHLIQRIRVSTIEVHLNSTVERAYVKDGQVTLETKNQTYTGEKLFITPYIYFSLEGNPPPKKTKFYHIYLLISDPTTPRFTYNYGLPKSSRMMNMTHFVDIAPGEQLIAIQTHEEMGLEDGEMFLNALKKKGLLDSSAELLQIDAHIYEQWPANSIKLTDREKPFIEVLETQHISNMYKYIAKWKERLRTYKDVTNF